MHRTGTGYSIPGRGILCPQTFPESIVAAFVVLFAAESSAALSARLLGCRELVAGSGSGRRQPRDTQCLGTSQGFHAQGLANAQPQIANDGEISFSSAASAQLMDSDQREKKKKRKMCTAIFHPQIRTDGKIRELLKFSRCWGAERQLASPRSRH